MNGSLAGCAIVALLLVSGPAPCHGAHLINTDFTGLRSGNGSLSESFAISADGRFAAFASSGTNHVANDTNGITDIFVRDWKLGSNVWDTTFSKAAPTAGSGSLPVEFTPDGRFLVFVSRATTLVPDISFPTESFQLYVHDLVSNVTSLVSVSADGTTAGNATLSAFNGGSTARHISSDGRFIAFVSTATNMVSLSDTNAGLDLFCRDMASGVTELITVSLDGASALSRQTATYCMNTNGRYFAFETTADNVVDGITNTNHSSQVYWRDRETGTNKIVSLTVDGALHGGGVFLRDMSADGRFICFTTGATNIVADQNDGNGTLDLFIRDMQSGEAWLVTRATNGMTTGSRVSGGRFSANGAALLFSATVADLVPRVADANSSNPDIFVHNVAARANFMVSISYDQTTGAEAFVSDGFARISASGRFVFFISSATNLVRGTTNHIQRLYLRDVDFFRTVNALHDEVFLTPSFNEARLAISETERFMFFIATGNFDPSIVDTNPNPDLFVEAIYRPKLTFLPTPGRRIADGIPGESYVLERTTNFSNWTPIGTNAADGKGQVFMSDPQPGPSPMRFYRLMWR